jgi:hypothetical protein
MIFTPGNKDIGGQRLLSWTPKDSKGHIQEGKCRNGDLESTTPVPLLYHFGY